MTKTVSEQEIKAWDEWEKKWLENTYGTMICPYCKHEFHGMFNPRCPKCGKDF